MDKKATRWIIEASEPGKPRMARIGKGLENMDRDFDIEFWQAQYTSARMQAAWELVELYLRQRGRESELRLQRSVALLQRGRGPLASRRRLRGDGVHGAEIREGS